jgi:hypothetical protein
MEINITEFFNSACPMDYSASRAEIGDNAGLDTWRAACEDASDYSALLDTDEKRQAFRDYVADFGAWKEEEIQAWTNDELAALFMQMISGDMRESDLKPDMNEDEWGEYEMRAANGNVSGRIYRGPFNQIYYYIGN